MSMFSGFGKIMGWDALKETGRNLHIAGRNIRGSLRGESKPLFRQNMKHAMGVAGGWAADWGTARGFAGQGLRRAGAVGARLGAAGGAVGGAAWGLGKLTD